MKSFKKALAVMLSVLMVVFSFPFSAMALDNPNNTDGKYAEDYDVVVHAYVMEYDGFNAYGFYSGGYLDNGTKFLDPTNMVKSNLSSKKGVFCIYITVENLDGCEGSQLTFNYDSTKITPANYARKTLNTGTAGASPLETAEIYDGADCTGTTAQLNGADVAYTVYCPKGQFTPANSTVIDDTDPEAVLTGAVIACFGFQMLEDTMDLTQVLTLDLHQNFTFFEPAGFKGNVNKRIIPYGGTWDDGVTPSEQTQFTFPEWGLAPAETPTEVTYTYTYADGHSTTVKAAEGTEPTAPTNTPTAIASNGDGTHTTTTYSWPAFAQGTTAYTEVATPSTVPCTEVVDAEAVAPGHTTAGSTKAWHCSVCNYTVTATPVKETGHTWDAGVVTRATCTDRGYTTYTCTLDGEKLVDNYTAIDPNNHTAVVTDNAVPATCTATGLTEGSHCTACGKTVVAQDVIPVDSSNHTKVVTDNAVDPTCTDPGLTEGSHCDDCKAVITAQQEVPALKHDWKVTSSTDATCVTAGKVTSECQRCHETKTETGVLDPTNHEGNIVTDAAVPATCTSTGLTEGSHCDACGAIVVAQTETPINPSNHTKVVTDKAVDPTCTDPGLTEGSHCDDCKAVIVAQQTINALDHAWDEGVVTKEATRAEDGVMTYTCTRDASHKKTEAIPALGVQITVTANELGTTTLNGVATTGAAQKVAYASTYTLTATANEGAEFVGWMVNGKMVSKNAVYTTGAYADLTYVPVFAPKAAVDFVVTFIDQFNKVIATIASSELAGLTELPSAPDYPHYTFEGYDLSLDEVKALKDSTVVTASYAKDDTTYTVNAYGCTITVDGRDYNETATVSHDARVTVKPNSADVAKSWTVNSSQAAFGAEYSFYVTADVEVAYSTLDVTAAPTVANVSKDQINDIDIRFLATRSVTDGYTLLESGFVYGKDMDSADLVLENVNGTTCRVIKNSNMAADGQFALTVGIASKTGKIGVAAYIIVKDSAGTVSAIYAPVQEWTY